MNLPEGTTLQAAHQHLGIAAAAVNEKRSSSSTQLAQTSSGLEELSGSSTLDPFSDELLQLLLSRLSHPLTARTGFIANNINMPLVKTNTQLSLGEELFHVRRIRGQGAYAKVFQASTLDPMNVTLLPDVPNEEEEDDESQMILKVQKPACPWEFYICHELRERLRTAGRPNNVLDSVMRVNRGYYYNNGSILASQYHRYGTLLDLLNGYKMKGLLWSNDLAMYFTIEVLSILENIHACDIIHADIKPDNFIVKGLPQINYSARSAEEMFADCPSALKIIDFGRAIDMRILPKGTSFTRKVTTEGFTCCEMQEGRAWTYQPDLYGAAATAHTMLWGTYMTVAKKEGVWALQGSNFKRYWNREAWQSVFHELLNVPSCDRLPSLSAMRATLQTAFFDADYKKNFKSKCNELYSVMITPR
uniref:Mitotic checkpoint serine/threonine-protein kinase BUB1-like n=1 Tax=Hirondellea gigas TaxID=1518452 RepID=A0A6A7G355_9CRUS